MSRNADSKHMREALEAAKRRAKVARKARRRLARKVMLHEQGSVEESRAEYIKARIKALQKAEPGLSFQAAWSRMQRENPALFVEVPEAESATYPPSRSGAWNRRPTTGELARAPRPDGWLFPVELQQHSWPAPSVLWKLFEYGHTFLCFGPGMGCVQGVALMVHNLPDPVVLDEPDFLGLVVVLLFLVHKMEPIRKWLRLIRT
jgi:hypothetical protein